MSGIDPLHAAAVSAENPQLSSAASSEHSSLAAASAFASAAPSDHSSLAIAPLASQPPPSSSSGSSSTLGPRMAFLGRTFNPRPTFTAFNGNGARPTASPQLFGEDESLSSISSYSDSEPTSDSSGSGLFTSSSEEDEANERRARPALITGTVAGEAAAAAAAAAAGENAHFQNLMRGYTLHHMHGLSLIHI